MKIKLLQNVALTLIISSSLISCEKDNSDDNSKGLYSNGIFILNEGNSSINSSVSFINSEGTAVYNDIFNQANGRTLGQYAQSIGAFDTCLYIMAANSNKVEVVGQTNFKTVTSINNLHKPRYFQVINNQKAYISQWGDDGNTGSIAVIDLTTNTIKSTITNTGTGTDKMLLLNNIVYAVNSAGYSNDSTVVVVNPTTDAVVTKIKVGYNPNSIVADKNGKIWVLCAGKWNSSWTELEKTGKLVKINPSTNTIEQTFSFTSVYSQPSSLTINSSKDVLIYTYNNGVYQQDIVASTLETAAKINRYFYHIAVDPLSGTLYTTNPKGASNGWVIRYNSSYAKIDSFQVEINPGEIFFKN